MVEFLDYWLLYNTFPRAIYTVTIIMFGSTDYLHFLFSVFILNKCINIHMTYNDYDNDNNQSEIITMLLCLYCRHSVS